MKGTLLFQWGRPRWAVDSWARKASSGLEIWIVDCGNHRVFLFALVSPAMCIGCLCVPLSQLNSFWNKPWKDSKYHSSFFLMKTQTHAKPAQGMLLHFPQRCELPGRLRGHMRLKTWICGNEKGDKKLTKKKKRQKNRLLPREQKNIYIYSTGKNTKGKKKRKKQRGHWRGAAMTLR